MASVFNRHPDVVLMSECKARSHIRSGGNIYCVHRKVAVQARLSLVSEWITRIIQEIRVHDGGRVIEAFSL